MLQMWTTIYVKDRYYNHIKAKHGKEVCHRFLRNECSRSSENCIFSHTTVPDMTQSQLSPQQKDFRERPITQLHSPVLNLHTMSAHIQNKQKTQGPQRDIHCQENIMDLIPQIVTQIVTALTQQMRQ